MARMKRLLATVLAFFTFALVGTVTNKIEMENKTVTAVGYVYDYTKVGGSLTAILNLDTGVLTIQGSGEMNDFKATTVPWYDSRDKITSVVLKEGITIIGAYAFNQCKNLTSVVIPESVTTIKSYAFCGTKLTEVVVPASVEKIYANAFKNDSLLSITFLGKETSVNSNAASAITPSAVIYCLTDSKAHEYAIKNERAYVLMDAVSAFKQVSVAIGSDLSVKYYVSLTAEEAATATMNFKVDAYNVNGVQGVATAEEGVYLFTFKGVAPQWMGEPITATLYLNGVEKETKTYSVLTYCKTILASNATTLGITEEKFATLKTLAADMLNYGAAAQTFLGYNTDKLVNAGIEGGSTYTMIKAKNSVKAGALSGVEMKGVDLHFETANALYFYFTATDVSNLNAVIYKNGLPVKTIKGADFAKATVGGVEMYYIATDSIKATELEDLFTATVYQGTDVLNGASIVSSVKSYVYAQQNNTEKAGLAELVQTLWLYGESAKAYQAA